MKKPYFKEISIICDYFDMNIEEFYASFKSRKTEYVIIRQILWHYLKPHKDKGISLKTLGLIFSKSHDNVLSGINRIKNLIETESKFKQQVYDIHKRLAYYSGEEERKFTMSEIRKMIELWLGSKMLSYFDKFYGENLN